MSPSLATKPMTGEYAPYYEKYISLAPESDIVSVLDDDGARTVAFLRGLTEEQGNYAYADGKWTIKQLLGHIIDGERVFSYRALRIARDDKTPLSGFEQDDYVATAEHNALTLAQLVDEFEALRRSTVMLFRNFPAAAWARMGTASENPVSVRAIAYITAGHERHHLAILREKYLAGN